MITTLAQNLLAESYQDGLKSVIAFTAQNPIQLTHMPTGSKMVDGVWYRFAGVSFRQIDGEWYGDNGRHVEPSANGGWL